MADKEEDQQIYDGRTDGLGGWMSDLMMEVLYEMINVLIDERKCCPCLNRAWTPPEIQTSLPGRTHVRLVRLVATWLRSQAPETSCRCRSPG